MHRISFLIVVEARRPIKTTGSLARETTHYDSTANDPAFYGIEVFRFVITVFRLTIKDVGVSVAAIGNSIRVRLLRLPLCIL